MFSELNNGGDYPPLPIPADMQVCFVTLIVRGVGVVTRMMPMPWVTHIPQAMLDELFENSYSEAEDQGWFEKGGEGRYEKVADEDNSILPPVWIFIGLDGTEVITHYTPDKSECTEIMLDPEYLWRVVDSLKEADDDPTFGWTNEQALRMMTAKLMPFDNDGGMLIAQREFFDWWVYDALGADDGGMRTDFDIEVPEFTELEGFNISDAFKDFGGPDES